MPDAIMSPMMTGTEPTDARAASNARRGAVRMTTGEWHDHPATHESPNVAASISSPIGSPNPAAAMAAYWRPRMPGRGSLPRGGGDAPRFRITAATSSATTIPITPGPTALCFSLVEPGPIARDDQRRQDSGHEEDERVQQGYQTRELSGRLAEQIQLES